MPQRPSQDWLGADHIQLLRAGLASDSSAIDHYQAWAGEVALEDHDDQSFGVLPLLYRNLVTAGYQGPDLRRLLGVYRQSWYRNRLIVRSAREVIAMLASEGIPSVILKGAAMATDPYYGDTGVRPISDVDLLVPHPSGARAASIVIGHGWELSTRRPLEQWVRNYHAANLTAGPTASVDVHWDLLVNGRDPPADAQMWSRARTTTLDDTEVLVLEPTDQLVHTLTHGRPGDLRWIADSVTITRATGGIDWDRFATDVESRRLIAHVHRNLGTVEMVMPGTIPGAVVDRLSATRRCLSDRLTDYPRSGTSRRQSVQNVVVLGLQRSRNKPWGGRAQIVRDLVLEATHATSISGAAGEAARAVVKGTPSSRGRR